MVMMSKRKINEVYIEDICKGINMMKDHTNDILLIISQYEEGLITPEYMKELLNEKGSSIKKAYYHALSKEAKELISSIWKGDFVWAGELKKPVSQPSE